MTEPVVAEMHGDKILRRFSMPNDENGFRAGSKLDAHLGEIREMLAKGKSLSEISRHLECDRSSLRHVIRTRNIRGAPGVVQTSAPVTATDKPGASLCQPTSSRVPRNAARLCWSRKSPFPALRSRR